MGKYDPQEIAQDLITALGLYPQIKAEVDAIEAIPAADRKPSTYINTASKIAALLAPLADSVEAHIQS